MNKRSFSNIKNQVNTSYNNEYELVTSELEYINTKHKIKIKHLKCGFEFEVLLSNFIYRKSLCPVCYGKKISYEEVKHRIEYFNEYELLTKKSEYINTKHKIKIKHLKCGFEYEVMLNNFMNIHRCPKCSGHIVTYQDIKNRIEYFNEYELLTSESEYIDTQHKIKIKHLKCGFEYEVKIGDFDSGNRCPKCSGHIVTYQDIKNRIEYFNEYELLTSESEYINTQHKIKIKHLKCGFEYEVRIGDFDSGSRCPKCSKIIPYYIIKNKIKLIDNEYELLTSESEYIDTQHKIKIKHLKCGFEYKVTINKFFNGNRCPKCNISKGEYKISSFLDELNIYYEREKTFEGCVYKKLLRFDFWIPDMNLLIEYDGIHHFMPFSFNIKKTTQMKKNMNFINVLIKDEIKNKYVLENNLALIRIPYYYYNNLEQILFELFNEFLKIS